MAINSSTSKYQTHNFTTYVEPNYTATNVYDQNGNPIELTHNMEDYCVAIDLAVEVKGRIGSCGSVDANNVKYIFHYNNSDAKDGGISFNGGRIEYGDENTGTRYLTSSYAEVFINDIKQNNNKYLENIGIESINISYNNWTVPEIEICFVDVRGGALFQPEELRNSNIANSVQGLANEDIEGSLFKSFFTFPYPIYTLVVKGMYGEPVSYRLSCSECNSEFDSASGNYKIRAKFVGYRFAFLNDVSFNAICAAPQSNIGGQYWRSKVESGEFYVTGNNGEMMEMPTLINVAKSVTQIGEEIDRLKSIENTNTADGESSEIRGILDKVERDFKNYAENKKGCIKSGTIFASIERIDNYNLKDLKNKIGGKVKEMTIELKKRDNGDLYIDTNNTEYADVLVDFQKSMLDINKGISQCIIYDVSEVESYLKSKEDAAIVNAEKIKDRINKERDRIISDTLGFKPTVKNITKILLAHFETLISMIDNCASEIVNLGRTADDMCMSASNSDFNEKCGYDIVPPFPKVTKEVTRGLTSTNEDAWMGDIINAKSEVTKEVDLVNDLLSGVAILDHELKELETQAATNHGTYTNGSYCKCPLTFMDPFLKESPFGNDIYSENAVEGDYKNNVALSINARFEQLYDMVQREINIGKTNINNNEITKSFNALGMIDASNIENEKSRTIPKKIVEVCKNPSEIVDTCNKWKTKEVWSRWIQGYDYKEGEVYEDIPVKEPLIPNRVVKDLDSFKNKIILDVDYMKYANMYNHMTHFDSTGDDVYPEGWRKYFNLDMGYDQEDGSGQMVVYRSYCADNISENTARKGNDEIIKGNIQYGFDQENGYHDTSDLIKKVIDWKNEESLNKKAGDFFIGDNIKGISNNYTLLNIWGIGTKWLSPKRISIKSDLTLFGQPEYYNESEPVRAYLFASSIGLASVDIEKICKKLVNGGFYIIPKPTLLAIGGLIYLRRNVDNINQSKSGILKFSTDLNYFLDGTDVNEDVKKIIENKQYADRLCHFFENWLSSGEIGGFRWFKHRLEFGNESEDGKVLIEKFISYYRGTTRGISNRYRGFGDWFKNNDSKLLDAYENVSVEEENLLLMLRQNSDTNKELVNFAFTPIMVITPIIGEFSARMFVGRNDNGAKNLYSACRKEYINGLIGSLNNKHKYDFEDKKIDDTTYTSDIKIATYNYLKAFYDRWLSGDKENVCKYRVSALMNDDDDESNTISEADKGTAGHFYFIDSYHNKIGDYAMLNMNDFNELLIKSTNQTSYSLMQFYQALLAKNRMMCFVIQNYMDMSNPEKMNNMFTPIPYIRMKSPNDIEDFVVVYSYEYSSKARSVGSDYTDDGFELTNEINGGTKIPKAILTKSDTNGYVIPTFGVSYGGQYQSYFTDIQVGQESGQITEQALQATFMIADMAKKTNSGGKSTNYIGQNLYTVYSNMSFTCKLTMLGCAWVRPLMYFTLLNVPLFRGSYLIQKVSHNITAGNMTTSIEGTRLSRYATPLSDMYLTEAGDQYLLETRARDMVYAASDVNNNCEYKKYAIEGDDNKIEYNGDVVTFAEGESISTRDALTYSLNYLVGDGDEVDVDLCVSILYNRWMNCGGADKMYENGLASIDKNIETGKKEKYAGIIDDVFSKSPSVLLNNRKCTNVTEPVTVYSNGSKTALSGSSKAIDINILQTVYDKCEASTYIKDEDDDNRYVYLPFLVQHESNVYLGGPGSYNSKKWVSTTNQSDSDRRDRVFNAISKSVEFTNAIKCDIEHSNDDSDENLFTITSKNGDLGKVYDMIATTYKEEIGSLNWVCNNENDVHISQPMEIRVSLKDNDKNHRMEMKIVLKCKNYAVYSTIDNVCDNYKYAVAKTYGTEIIGAKERNNPGEVNFVFPMSKDALNKYYEMIDKVKDCPVSYEDALDDVIANDTSTIDGQYVWTGVLSGENSEKNRKKPVDVGGFDDFQIGKMTSYIWEKHKRHGKGGNCAKFVREAIEAGRNGESLGGKCPLSACRYISWMEKYGFSEVANGFAPKNPNGYQPQDGDIAVVAGRKTSNRDDMHGHIHIYNAENKKWVSDIESDVVWMYKDSGRPYHIFRFTKKIMTKSLF